MNITKVFFKSNNSMIGYSDRALTKKCAEIEQGDTLELLQCKIMTDDFLFSSGTLQSYKQYGSADGQLSMSTTQTIIDLTSSNGASNLIVNTSADRIINSTGIGGLYQHTCTGYVYNGGSNDNRANIQFRRGNTGLFGDFVTLTVKAGEYIPFSISGISDSGTSDFNWTGQVVNSPSGGSILVVNFKGTIIRL